MIRGEIARENALHWEPIFPVSTVKKKMSTCNIYTVENALGWACLISTLKERLFGAMGHLLTSITGQGTNQTTFTMKIVFTHLGCFVMMSTNGTMSIAQIATGSLVRRVRLSHSISLFIHLIQKGCFGHWQLGIGKLLFSGHSSEAFLCFRMPKCPKPNSQ